MNEVSWLVVATCFRALTGIKNTQDLIGKTLFLSCTHEVQVLAEHLSGVRESPRERGHGPDDLDDAWQTEGNACKQETGALRLGLVLIIMAQKVAEKGFVLARE